MSPIVKAAFFAFNILISFQTVFSQTGLSDTTRLEKQISILNGKAYASFPASAVVSPRVADIMAADPNENKETRIIFDIGNMKLVLFAQELFSLSGDRLFEDISKEEEPSFNFRRKELTNSDSFITVLSTPALFDTSAGAILVNSLLIKSPDNTVALIDAYININAFYLKDEFSKLTENIFKTLTKGNRRISLEAKEETYKIPGTSATFNFKLPKNYFVSLDENMMEYGFSDSVALKAKGTFLQKNIEWLYFKEDAQSFFLKEQIIPADELSQGLVMHVAVLSNKKEQLEELLKVAESIKIIR
ncbi:MAG: hypothetical protein IPK57_00745 [Chitinophagaceae bacterium]|nr:hypothetical protein [Chitinophagaceae bacterium]